MRPLYALMAAVVAIASADACNSDETVNPVTTSTGSTATANGGAGGGLGGSASNGGGGQNLGGATNGGGGAGASGGASSGGNTASGGASAGGGGDTSSGGSGGGGPPPPECTTQNDTCPAGKYCSAPGCGAGHCKDKPAEGMMSNDEGLVCGCDGVTYWNAHFAAHSGVSVAMTGACPGNSGPACSVNQACPAGLTCNVDVLGSADCSPLAQGVCWGIPSECPTDGPQAKACSDGSCQYQCALIASQHSWYDDGMCP